MARILVVDDEADILRSMKVYLESALGIEVATEPSGLAGLERLRAEPFDLVLSDFRMPGMDGIRFLAAALALRPDTPRILLTAFPDMALAEQALSQARVCLFLTKPIQPAALEDAIRAELGR
jgi:two-component system probable response regulator PhcQ